MAAGDPGGNQRGRERRAGKSPWHRERRRMGRGRPRLLRSGHWVSLVACAIASLPWRAETRIGATVFGKNSDRSEHECQPFRQFPAAPSTRPVPRRRCTHIEIPQVAETYAVMGHSPWWVWGFEHGVNEHAVAIGNETVFSKEAIEERPGLIGMDLVRLGLERGRTAREALEVMATLIETLRTRRLPRSVPTSPAITTAS